jgi:hypothetical protein
MIRACSESSLISCHHGGASPGQSDVSVKTSSPSGGTSTKPVTISLRNISRGSHQNVPYPMASSVVRTGIRTAVNRLHVQTIARVESRRRYSHPKERQSHGSVASVCE